MRGVASLPRRLAVGLLGSARSGVEVAVGVGLGPGSPKTGSDAAAFAPVAPWSTLRPSFSYPQLLFPFDPLSPLLSLGFPPDR